jgi:hypothetical protein
MGLRRTQFLGEEMGLRKNVAQKKDNSLRKKWG